MEEQTKPLTDETVTIELSGPTGNAYYILGAVSKVLRAAGHGEKVADYQRRATAGDYQNLLAVSREFVNLETI